MSIEQKRLDRPELRELIKHTIRIRCRVSEVKLGIIADILLALIPDRAAIIREEQKRSAGALRVLFEKGWTLNDLIQAEDTMEEEYINIVEEAKKQERRDIGEWLLDKDIMLSKDEKVSLLETLIADLVVGKALQSRLEE